MKQLLLKLLLLTFTGSQFQPLKNLYFSKCSTTSCQTKMKQRETFETCSWQIAKMCFFLNFFDTPTFCPFSEYFSLESFHRCIHKTAHLAICLKLPDKTCHVREYFSNKCEMWLIKQHCRVALFCHFCFTVTTTTLPLAAVWKYLFGINLYCCQTCSPRPCSAPSPWRWWSPPCLCGQSESQ